MKAKSIISLLRNFPSRRLSQALFQLLLRQETLRRHFGPQPESGVRCSEFRNKLEAFYAFEYADVRLRLHDNFSRSLPELICKAETCHLSPFVIEGIAYHLTRSKLVDAKPDCHTPVFDDCAGLAPRTVVLLHAGLGLALAESALQAMDQEGADPASLLGNFAQLCSQYSQPGYAGVAFEALGLVARTLRPHLISRIDRCLCSRTTDLAYFWHGVGRGIYFAPEYLWATHSAPWTSLAACLQEPPHDLAMQNARAGFAWAISIINMDTPQVMQTFISHHGHLVLQDPAFLDGARAAAGFWKHVSLQEQVEPEALFRYRLLAESV